MTTYPELMRAYEIGKSVAESEHLEKIAFLGGVASTGKFLLGMGNLGAKGSRLARISSHHVGMPLGFGALGAATAEEGERAEGFAKGLVGGLVFNAAMPLGGHIGKKLFAPGFGGKNSFGIMKRIGFGDDAARNMSSSQALNKKVHGSLGRKLDAGTASTKQVTSLGDDFTTQTSGLNLTEDLAKQQQKLQAMFDDAANLTGAQQAELKKLYSQFTSGLYKGGYTTGSKGQRAMLKGLRFSKGLGTMAGGMGLGMAASHQVEGMMDSHPASVFDSRGGH